MTCCELVVLRLTAVQFGALVAAAARVGVPVDDYAKQVVLRTLSEAVSA